MPAPTRNSDSTEPDPIRRAGQDPRPSSRSAKRAWLLAGAVSLAAHMAVLFAVLLARADPSPLWTAPQPPPPVMVTLFKPPPPRPEPAPGPAADPQPPAGPAAPTPAAPPAKARPTPPAPAPRPSRAPIPPPRHVETVAARAPAPPAPMATLSDAQLAGATVAGPGGGVGGRGGGGTGGAGGSGAGDGGCDMVRWLQDALRDDPEVRAAVAGAQREVGPGKALLVWNGEWIRNPGEAGEGLAGVRQAIAMEVAFAPHACRAQPMRGLVLISFSDAAGGPRLALGKGSWRWGDMLRGR